jgi:hypothetical protein
LLRKQKVAKKLPSTIGQGLMKRNIFPGKTFADPSIKKQKKFTQLQISIKKINTHPWLKNLQKHTIQLSHMSFTTSVK